MPSRRSSPWTPERYAAAHGQTVHDMLTRRRISCALHLTRALEATGRVELGPRTMARLREAGYGATIVAWALAAMVHRGVATVRRERGTVVLTETPQEQLAA